MSITIADEKLISQLAWADETIEVRASDGRYLGVFSPAHARGPEPTIPEDELLAREDPTTGKWFTAAEVEAKLQGLRCTP
jgi:hypothetical protein